MRKLITTIALLALVDTSVAIAQPAANPAAPPIDELGPAIAAGGAGGTPPAAC